MPSGYTYVELAYLAFLRAKHGAIKMIDAVRPKIFLRRPLTEYSPREFYGMEIGEILDMLGARNRNIRITY